MEQNRREFLSNAAKAILGGAAVASRESSQNTDQSSSSSVPQANSDEWSYAKETLDGTWPHPNYKDKNRSRNPNSRAPDHNLQKAAETEEGGFRPDSFTVVDESNIYVGDTSDKHLKAFDRQTGVKNWEFDVGSEEGAIMTSPISVSDDNVYVSPSAIGEVIAIDRNDGQEVARKDTDSASEVKVSDSGNVIVSESTGSVSIFDENLDNRRKFERTPGKVNITDETVVIDDQDRVIYSETPNSEDAFVRMIDPDTAESISTVPVDQRIYNGAVLHDDLYIYQEGSNLRAREVTDSGFGNEKWSVNAYGSDDFSPVVFDGFVFGGNNDGEVYKVDVESGEKETIDKDGFDVKVDALVAGEHTLLVGDVMRNMRAYDLDTGELVTDFDGFRNPDAVVSGNLVERVYNPDNGNFKLRISEGEYRDVDLEGPDAGYDVVRDSAVVGDGMVLEADVEAGDGSVEGYEWSLEGGGLEESFSGGESWNITEVVSSIEDEVDEDYQEMLTATVEVTDENGKSDSHTDSFPVEGLNADLSIDDRVDKGDGASASFDYDQDHVQAVDSIYVEVLDESGETVNEYDVGSLEENFTIAFDDPGEYTVSVDYGLLDSYTEEIDVQVVGEDYLPPVVGDDSPTDPDDDGLYEDVDGGSQFNIFDVQAFFNNFQSEAVQEYAGRYNFDGDGDITIFDVQALFNEL
jgi:outer membrane protein assembly factor BamB